MVAFFLGDFDKFIYAGFGLFEAKLWFGFVDLHRDCDFYDGMGGLLLGGWFWVGL